MSQSKKDLRKKGNQSRLFNSTLGTRFLHNAITKYGIYLQEFTNGTVKIYGDPLKTEEFVREITRFLDSPLFLKEFIPLRGKCISKLMINNKENLNRIQRKFQNSSIFLNLVKRQIIITGPTEDVNKIKVEIFNYIEDMRLSKKEDKSTICSICQDFAIKPYSLLHCADTFCTVCLKEYLMQIISNPNLDELAEEIGFPLTCPECPKEIYLRDLMNLLDMASFEKLLKVSMKKHAKSAYQCCPTEFCQQVYRKNDNRRFECDLCQSVYCKVCNEQYHEAGNCEDTKQERELSSEVKEQLGIKNCPSCNRHIEKKDGCNHMKCGCGCHFCWVCLAGFESAQACISHIITKHPTMADGLIIVEDPQFRYT